MVGRFLLALLLFNLTACSTMHTVKVPGTGSMPDDVYHGSKVELVTIGGEEYKFTVTLLTGQGIGGDPGFFTYPEISSLKVMTSEESSRTFWAVLLGIAAAALLIVAVQSAAETAGAACLLSGGDC